jgi:hypothetical protein
MSARVPDGPGAGPADRRPAPFENPEALPMEHGTRRPADLGRRSVTRRSDMTRATEPADPDVGRRPKERLISVACYVLPLLLVAAGTAFGVNRAMAGWQNHTEAFQVDVNAETARGPGQTDDVIILGDSITEQSARALRDSLSNEFRLRIRGRGGYRVEDMEPYAIESATTRPEQVVINLATNDVLQQWPIQRTIEAYERLLEDYSAVRCVHVVTITEMITPPADDTEINLRAVLLNLTLHKLAATKNLKIIDWTKLMHTEESQGWPRGALTSDGIHPNSYGRQKLVQMYKDALRSC